jgi:uncharacterized protein YdhG (YjbR/CyaY superfamily)
MPPDARVDAYLEALPAEQRDVLERLRRDVQRLVPDADETISYGMPAFRLDGRFLLSFAAWRRHCSLYPFDDALLERHAELLRGYGRTKGGLHFSAARPLPPEVLADLVALRVGAIGGRSRAV